MWSVLTCCVQIEIRLRAKTGGRNPPKTNASRWFPLYRMVFLSPQCTSARYHPHSPLLFLPVSLRNLFPIWYRTFAGIDASNLQTQPPRCSAQSALTKENVRLLLSVSFSGLLNKWLLVWLFLDLVLTWVDFLLYCHYLRNNLQMQQINAWEPDWAVPQTGSSKDTLWKDVHPLAPNCDFLILKPS